MEARLGEYCQNDKNRNMPKPLQIIIHQVQSIKISLQTNRFKNVDKSKSVINIENLSPLFCVNIRHQYRCIGDAHMMLSYAKNIRNH